MSFGGLLNVNKPSGPTSFQIVKHVRKILQVKKVGHCGTLDPMASGVLLVLFGSATVYSEKFMSKEKVYRGEMRLGLKTDSGDITGNILETAPVPDLDSKTVRSALKRFTGEITQVPPMYSAVKWKGRKLYEYARKGLEIDRKPRKVTVFSFHLLGQAGHAFQFRLACSKGTYVRTLVEDVGEFLKVPATLSLLVREKSGPYSLDSSISWEELCSMDRKTLLSKSVSLPQLQ